ncbi:MAG TPA: universal stress protein [Pyrinomonadaceae bacterium]|nr:universal stress protein [Pyrinomonadaceae bacterium]
MRILIGYDGSTCAHAALDDLRRAGLPRNAEAVILAVTEVWLPALPIKASVKAAESFAIPITNTRSPQAQVSTAVAPVSEARSLAVEAKARLQTRFSTWVIKAEESSGSPSHEILKRAAELKPHLIVVGCQGRSALGGFLLGSVSQKVVNEAHCTVRVCRGSAWKDGSPVRIVIGLDGTPSSELAVNAVASRAWPISSEVRLVTVVDAINAETRENVVLQLKKNSARSMKRDTVEEFMKEATERLRGAQLIVSTRIEEGDPKHVLIADAEEWGADCIFLGTSAANNLLERFLLGNVATAIVSRAHCSVEVVRCGY